MALRERAIEALNTDAWHVALSQIITGLEVIAKEQYARKIEIRMMNLPASKE